MSTRQLEHVLFCCGVELFKIRLSEALSEKQIRTND